MSIYSSKSEIEKICKMLSKYCRLPLSSDIPGAVMESILALVREGEVPKTYDYVDVVNKENKIGWQVKSTKASTPVTWKRAKIPNAEKLIRDSHISDDGCQILGDTIINFCNDHAIESMKKYHLNEIGYSRLIIDDTNVIYFERLLCNIENPLIFDPKDFLWNWSKPKSTRKKEQLPAFHGTHKKYQKKWWAWHGLGENQLHFSGEKMWWPNEGDPHMASFNMPSESSKISFERLIEIIDSADSV